LRRRDFVTAIGVAAVSWPQHLRAQADRQRRIGVLLSLAADDLEAEKRVGAFRQGLQQLGWIEGSNIRLDIRWSGGDIRDIRKYAAELVALAPDVILASGGSVVAPLQEATRTIPIVFTTVIDPVGAGYVESLARPGGNSTGFAVFEHGISVKWLELLRQVAPGAKRVAVLRDTALAAGVGQFGAIQGVAPSFGVELTPLSVRDGAEIERGISGFARPAGSALIVTGSGLANVHRKLIIDLAARYRLPAIYPSRFFVADGGLISYGVDSVDPHRRAAGYVDRILKGEKPADLPVQEPTKYVLAINLKTAKELGLEMVPSLVAAADEIFE
jgi:putative ABC transport system substrate-binding protein